MTRQRERAARRRRIPRPGDHATTTDQTIRLTDGTPAAGYRWRAARARRESLDGARHADAMKRAGLAYAAETAYRCAAIAVRDAAQQYVNAAGARGGTSEDTAAALRCCREAYDLDLLAEACSL